jgi:hypothetical protein
MKLENSRLVLGLLLEAIALCLILSYRFVNISATATLAIFNLLFLSLTIYLEGTLNKKLSLLALGNILGLFWNWVFQHFAYVGVTCFGDLFNVFYAIFYPFLNFTWIVSFWSLSLAVLPKPKNTLTKAKS